MAAVATTPLDALSITTIRCLAMDAVQAAKSGHPGAPMGLAPVAFWLWQHFLRYDPTDPLWPDRDRFVLSNGHASMLLYSMILLSGVRAVKDDQPLAEPSLTIDEIKRFRQLGSKTPGHPEYHHTSGVETTTGPLGQGLANSVGMAIAGQWLKKTYNRPGFDLFDYNVYAICGDGCMMEGISHEAASLAGHLGLPNLCWIYDNNHITIEGKTSLAYSDDVRKRFEGYHFNVLHVTDANDLAQIDAAFKAFPKTTDKPTLIIVNSHIAWGAPTKQDTKEAHGEPLGEDEIKATKKVYGWPEDAKFLVPDGVYDHFKQGIGQRGKALRDRWYALFQDYKAKHPDLADQIQRMLRRDLPVGWDKDLPTFPADAKGMATRVSSGQVLSAVAKAVPWFVGGAADLAPSTKTLFNVKEAGTFQKDSYGGRNFHFGIREHAMTGVVNGLALTRLRPFGSGFLIFSDYGRGSIRLGAVMELPTIHVFTHDSIGVGEDGPTHQPIEHLPSLRAMPGLLVIRPCDANEVVEAWRVIMKLKHEPAILALTRQDLPTLDRSKFASAAGLARGAYVLTDASGGTPDVILMASGSEVQWCVGAIDLLKTEGIRARVVSMPCWELFDRQDQAYRDSVLPPSVKARVSVEMASVLGWSKYVGDKGVSIGMKTFGASAPLKDLLKHFGFSAEAVAAAARELVRRGG